MPPPLTRRSRGRNPSTYARGQTFGHWTLDSPIGGGGNGDVWRVTRDGWSDHAIKLLRSIDSLSYARFQAETAALAALEAVPGVIPMIDSHIPASAKGITPWFVMPIAETFEQYEVSRTPQQIVGDFIELAETLTILHSKHIAHRDIKPANLLYFQGRLCYSDFGLVKFPKRAPLTPKKRDVGPKFTMAPEMRRSASEADGRLADVYSFSKTLWIALTKQVQGFDGQYTTGSVLALRKYLPKLYTTTLDQLLIECTDNLPRRRPSISRVADRLREWMSIAGDFHKRNLSEWMEMQHTLFPTGAPTRATWTDIDSICSVLGEIATTHALNHMFYPTGGGNTITAVSRATEDGFIALHIGEKMAEVLKPSKLTYESFGTDPSWNYFRLEVEPTKPVGIKGAQDEEGIRETLTEISPGRYVAYHHWDNNEFQGEALPDEARPISRYMKGSFVFFGTRSVYNLNPGTYDARHNAVSEDEFRRYIQRNAHHHAPRDA